jgi:hypothetical protein
MHKVTQDKVMLPYIIFYRLIRINEIIRIILFFAMGTDSALERAGAVGASGAAEWLTQLYC